MAVPCLDLEARARRSGGLVKLFSFIRRARVAGLRAGVAVSDREVAVAVVRRAAGRRPVIVNCVSQPADGYADLAVERALQGLELGRTPVSAVIGAGDYQIVQVEAPEVPAAELRQATRWRLRDQFDFPIDSATIDLFDVPATTRRRARMLFAVAAHGGAIESIGATMTRATQGFDVIDIPELCQRNLGTLLPQDTKGLALLILREQFAQLVLTRGGLLYLTRRFELGQRASKPDTLDYDVSTGEAQIDSGSLALELQRSLDYYESHFDQSAIGDLVIAPGGARALALAKSLSADTGLRISTLNLSDCMDVADGVTVPEGWLPCMAVGAALRTDAAAT